MINQNKSTGVKKNSKILLLVMICFFLSLNSFSQGGKWLNYSSGTWVRDIVFAGNYAWVATSGGLVKLDTLTGDFIVYDKQNLPIPNNNFCSAAYDSINNELWFGLFQAGALKFNGTDWTYYNNINDVRDITFDNQNNKWFATTSSGVFKYNDTTWVNYNQWNSNIQCSCALSIAIDKNNIKWIGTSGGLCKLDDTTWVNYNTGNSGMSDNYIIQVAIDKYGKKWLATLGGGINVFDDTTFTVYNYANTNNVIVNTQSITIDKNDIKWVGCANSGIASFDNTTWKKYDQSDYSYLDQTSNIIIDNNNNKWIGSIGYGLFKYYGSKWVHYNTSKSDLSSQELIKIYIDSKGNKWFGGSQGGACKFDGENWTDYNSVNSGIGGNSVYDYLEDSKGNMWVLTNNGIKKFDGNTWTNIPMFVAYPSGVPNSIAIDKYGRKWIGTSMDGFGVYNDTSWVAYYNTSNSQLPSNTIHSITIDKNNIKWIGTDNGVVKYNDTTWTVYNGVKDLPSKLIQAIAIDSNNVKWIGTDMGVVSFNDTAWTGINIQSSLFGNVNVHNIIIDISGNKWISATSGLYFYDGVKSTEYTSRNSMLQYDWVWDTKFDSDGNLWIASNGGGVSMIVMDSLTSDLFPEFNYAVDTTNNIVDFTNISKGTILTYYWDFGDNSFSNDVSPKHKYSKGGTYKVCLTGKNLLHEKKFTQDVLTSDDPCRTFFRYDTTTTSAIIDFYAIPYDSSTTYYWNFGDGYTSTLEEPVHQYTYPGNYNVVLVTTNEHACVSQFEQIVAVGNFTKECIANYIYDIDLSSNVVSFINKSQTSGTPKLTWDFGDGQIDSTNQVKHHYDSDGYYNVCLSVSDTANNCKDIYCQTIKINNDTNFCKASFIAQVDPSKLKAYFTNTSTGSFDEASWEFGDSTTSALNNPIHTYADTGYYTVHLRIRNTKSGMVDDHLEMIGMNDYNTLQASFGFDVDSTFNRRGYIPVKFKGSSFGETNSLEWDFGDGSTNSSNMSPTHNYASEGFYHVCLTVSNNNLHQSDVYCSYVTVSVATSIKNDGTAPVETFEMYPNPAKDVIKLSADQLKNGNTITITNAIGQVVYSNQFKAENKEIDINIQNLQSGLYFVRIGNTVRKLLVN